MVDFMVRRQNNSLVPHTSMDMAVLQDLSFDNIFRVKLTKPRSAAHHGLFFAAIAEAFENWPENHDELTPENEDHLRAYLICKSHPDYREALAIFDMNNAALPFNEMVRAFAIAAAQKRICFPRVDLQKGKLYIVAPKSIKWDKMDQSEFNKLSSYVSEVLKEETGLSLEDYKKNFQDKRIGLHNGLRN